MVSIIIPIYNGKQYINNAIKSCLRQSYKNIEIIVIDDGSTDGFIKEDIKTINKNIRFYTQENQGLGMTRNLGINLAKGEYIFFLDVDDIIPIHAINTLRTAIKDYDFIMGRSKRVLLDNHNSIYKEYIWKKELYTKDHNKYNLIVDAVVTNKLYKKKFLMKENIKFLQGLYEDKLFIIKIFEKSNHFKYIKDIVYYWQVHHNSISITNNKSIDNVKERMKALKQCLMYTNDEKMKWVLCKNIIKHDLKLNIVKNDHIDYLNSLYDIYREFIQNNKKYIDTNDFFLDKKIIDNIVNKKLIIKEFKQIYYENNTSNIFIKIKKYIRYSIYYLRAK